MRTLNLLYILTLSILSSSICIAAQPVSVDDVVTEIIGNNLSLRSAEAVNNAESLERRSDNRLGNTEVEFSPFFRSGISGMASSELIVKQEFDFPTIYADRRRANASADNADAVRLDGERRQTALEIRELCFNYLAARDIDRVLSVRLADSDSLVTLAERQYREGAITRLDLNNYKLDRLDIASKVEENRAAMDQSLRQLSLLNGGNPVDLSRLEWPALPAVPSPSAIDALADNSTAVADANALITVAEQERRLAAGSWAPSIAAGYRMNTDYGEPAANGVIVGLAFPLFSTGAKVKAADSRRVAANIAAEEARIESRESLMSTLAEMQSTERQLELIDVDLIENTIDLLTKSAALGQSTVTDYLNRIQPLRSALVDAITLRAKLHTLNATLNR